MHFASLIITLNKGQLEQ